MNSLRSSMGPSTRKAILAAGCSVVKGRLGDVAETLEPRLLLFRRFLVVGQLLLARGRRHERHEGVAVLAILGLDDQGGADGDQVAQADAEAEDPVAVLVLVERHP